MNRRRMMMLQETDNKLYLYNYGDECIDVTGGWRNGPYIRGNEQNRSAIKNETEMILIAKHYNGASTTSMCTVNPIDLSEYRYIYVDCDYSTSNTNCQSSFRLSDKSNDADTTAKALGNFVTLFLANANSFFFSGIERVEIPHETLTKPTASYLNFIADTWGANIGEYSAKFVIRRVWLEK